MGHIARDEVAVCSKSAEQRARHYLSRFRSQVRADVRAFARSGDRRLDLAVAFPGAAVAIVTEANGAAASREATRLVDKGAPLKEIQGALGLPAWTRRLPPEAFTTGPRRWPADEDFGRRIVACLPRTRGVAADWLSTVLYAERAGGSEFALWIARQRIFVKEPGTEHLIHLLAAYAWFSSNSGDEAASHLSMRWQPNLSLDSVLRSAKIWFNRLRLVAVCGKSPLASAWLRAGKAGRYNFVPLITADAVLADARTMCNCIDQYARRLAHDQCRLFSVRNASGEAVATVEIAHHPRESGFLAITQLKGRHNAPATSEIWQAAYQWLGQQPELARSPFAMSRGSAFDAARWSELMAPYHRAKGKGTGLPQAMTPLLLDSLDAQLRALAERAKIKSWLFT